jgi:hypothetical protein
MDEETVERVVENGADNIFSGKRVSWLTECFLRVTTCLSRAQLTRAAC